MECIMGCVLIALLAFGLVSFRAPDEDEIILHLIKLGAIKESIVDHEVQHTLVDEKFRPLLDEWQGWGLSLNGNIISH